MNARRNNWSGMVHFFFFTLDLNFRSKQALVYGYLVPILFLVAFGSVFRSESPALLGEMGQLLTITILGGACFGLPTALVAERERGIWRRYRLLPVRTFFLVVAVLAARIVIVVSAVVMQVCIAHLVYHTPLPVNLVHAALGVLLVTTSFLGLGLAIAGAADDVPAVQAMGQCIFLPMIMIGGVGVPLLALPEWARNASGFMPGRYSVDLLQVAYCEPRGISGEGFSIFALVVIGACAFVVGSKLFRWECGRRIGLRAWAWILVAVFGWVAVGFAAALSGHLAAPLPPDIGFDAITDAEIESVSYANLPGDNEFVSRLAPPFALDELPEGMSKFERTLNHWAPGHASEPGQCVRSLLCVAGIADVGQDLHEGEIARLVFEELRARFDDHSLSKLLTWIILYPNDGVAITTAPELGMDRQFKEVIIRERTVLYATKLLGRIRGKIKD